MPSCCLAHALRVRWWDRSRSVSWRHVGAAVMRCCKMWPSRRCLSWHSNDPLPYFLHPGIMRRRPRIGMRCDVEKIPSRRGLVLCATSFNRRRSRPSWHRRLFFLRFSRTAPRPAELIPKPYRLVLYPLITPFAPDLVPAATAPARSCWRSDRVGEPGTLAMDFFVLCSENIFRLLLAPRDRSSGAIKYHV